MTISEHPTTTHLVRTRRMASPTSTASGGKAGRRYRGSFDRETEKKTSTINVHTSRNNRGSNVPERLAGRQRCQTVAGMTPAHGSIPATSTAAKNQAGLLRA